MASPSATSSWLPSSDHYGRMLVMASAAFGIAATFYYMKSRRKGRIYITKEKIFQPRTVSSMASLPKNKMPNPTAVEDEAAAQQLQVEHPEGPNIGFGSDPSWLARDRDEVPEKTDLLHLGHSKGGKMVIVMVGLPGSGKTYIARKVSRYLRWISYRTKVFSLAKYRLERLGTQDALFFDPNNAESYQQRKELLMSAVDDVLNYLNRGGEIAIIDGTNTSLDRRQIILERVSAEDGFQVLWIESICENKSILDRHVNDMMQSPDFKSAVDFQQRMNYYRQRAETLTAEEGRYIKIYDTGRQLILNEISGFLPTKVASFVMNLHTAPRQIFMTRAGESVFGQRGQLGGELSAKGLDYAKALAEFMERDDTGFRPSSSDLSVWSSTMRCARQTAGLIKCKKYVEWRSLREIEVGVCDGLSYEQVKVRFPLEYKARMQDKLRYRYPRGESYFDVITRLESIIFEIERNEGPLLIVAHQAVLRCLYAYFLDLSTEELPFVSIPLNTLIRLEPQAYGCKEKRVKFMHSSDESSRLEEDD